VRPPKPTAKALKPGHANGVGSAYLFGLHTAHVDERPALVGDGDDAFRRETPGPGGRRVLACVQENLRASEAARSIFDYKVGFLTQNVRSDDESDDPSDDDAAILEEKPLTRAAARRKDKDLAARFAQFFELYRRESGCRGLASFFPHVEPNDQFVPDIGASFEFRDHELTRLEALWAFRAELSQFTSRAARGKDGKRKNTRAAIASRNRQADGEFPAQAFEGNVDYLWAIETSKLEDALKEKLLRKSILALFAKELAFRRMYPELESRVKRKLQVPYVPP
jgi:hypothetical protein